MPVFILLLIKISLRFLGSNKLFPKSDSLDVFLRLRATSSLNIGMCWRLFRLVPSERTQHEIVTLLQRRSVIANMMLKLTDWRSLGDRNSLMISICYRGVRHSMFSACFR